MNAHEQQHQHQINFTIPEIPPTLLGRFSKSHYWGVNMRLKNSYIPQNSSFRLYVISLCNLSLPFFLPCPFKAQPGKLNLLTESFFPPALLRYEQNPKVGKLDSAAGNIHITRLYCFAELCLSPSPLLLLLHWRSCSFLLSAHITKGFHGSTRPSCSGQSHH